MINIEEKRKKALSLIDAGMIAMRSCHECNGAHEHFTDKEDCVIQCFLCGRYWLGAIDITIYDGEPKE